MPLCLMMKKNHFKQKLLLWPQFLSKSSHLENSENKPFHKSYRYLQHAAFLFFLSGVSFVSIHDSQNSKGKNISLTPLYRFFPFHRHLDISRVITAESSPLHIASSRNRTRNIWLPNSSH